MSRKLHNLLEGGLECLANRPAVVLQGGPVDCAVLVEVPVPREVVLSLFANRCSQELVLLDEPEAALSPERPQAFPRATLYSFSGEGFTRNVLNASERFLAVLFEAETQP
jgi:hypothetical protein